MNRTTIANSKNKVIGVGAKTMNSKTTHIDSMSSTSIAIQTLAT